MSRQHGSICRVYLGSRDVSDDLSDINVQGMVDVIDSTSFASMGAKRYDPGMLDWTADVSAFYDPSIGGIGRQLETLLGAAGGIISIYDGYAAYVGGNGVLLSDSILIKRDQPISVVDLIKLKGSFKSTGPSGRAGLYGVLLHPNLIQATSAAGASVDNGAASANGGRASMHITAAAGTGGIISIADSADNATFATIATFTTASAPGAQTIEIAGTVRRYLHAAWAINSTSSLTFVSGFSRY